MFSGARFNRKGRCEFRKEAQRHLCGSQRFSVRFAVASLDIHPWKRKGEKDDASASLVEWLQMKSATQVRPHSSTTAD